MGGKEVIPLPPLGYMKDDELDRRKKTPVYWLCWNLLSPMPIKPASAIVMTPPIRPETDVPALMFGHGSGALSAGLSGAIFSSDDLKP